MAFSEETKQAALKRAGNQCECSRLACKVHREYRCPKKLVAGYWHAHHVVPVADGGKDTLSNCQALCIPCHEETPSYGRS
jgi:5-methylcytosine-specific restriction endonuclease McrA